MDKGILGCKRVIPDLLWKVLILAVLFSLPISGQKLKDLPHRRTGNFQLDSLYFLADRGDSTKMWKGKGIFDSTLMVNRKNTIKKTLQFGTYGVFKLPARDTTANKSLYTASNDTSIVFVKDSLTNKKDTIITGKNINRFYNENRYYNASKLLLDGTVRLTGRDTAKTDYIYSKTVSGVRHLYWRRNDTTAVKLDSIGAGAGTAGGWTLSGTIPAKIYQSAGIKTHVRSVAGDTTGTALFNVYGTSTFGGASTFNADVIFGASADLTLPTADPTPDVGKFWRSTDVLKYTNSVGDAKTLTFGTGTANELTYWSSANSLGTLPVATYPSLTEMSYVKGLSSAVQTQLNGKLTSTLTNTYLFVGNISNVATGVAMSGDATIANTGVVTVANDSHDHTGSTISGLAVADFTSPNISNWTNDANYVTTSTEGWRATDVTSIGASLTNSAGVLSVTSGTYEPAFTTLGISKGGTGQDGTYFSANNFVYWDNVNNRLASSGYSSSSFVPTTRTLTINGTGYDLSANRSWTVTTDPAAAYSWTGLHTWTKTNIAASTNLIEVTATATNTSTTLDVVAGKFTGTAGHANHTAYGVRAYGVGYLSGGTAVGLYATASTGANNYAGYFDNGMVYIKENLQVGAGKFTISTTGTLIEVNNTLASDVSNYVLMSDGTSYTPVNLLGRDNTYTGSVTYTPEGLTYNTTMDAASKTVISGGGTGNGTTTTLSNGINGQIIILINTSSSYTWTLNETGNINLAGSADYVMGQSDTITLVYESGTTKWLETARSNN